MDSVDWPSIRAKFPVCSRMVYLNAAGGSPMSVDASVEGKRYFDEMLLFGDTCWDDWLLRTETVRKKVADLVGATKDEIAFVSNTSSGMGMLAQLLRGSGKILTMEDEFPSSTLPWLNLGFEADFVKPVGTLYPLHHIERAIKPEHRILLTSYVQYKTGFRQHLRELGKLCKSAKLLFVVNATQAMGIFPVDVVKDGIDFLVFSGLKWACAGYGTSAMVIQKKWLGGKIPMAGWRSVRTPESMNNLDVDFRPEASAFEAGSPSFPAIFALGGALNLLTSIGTKSCMERVLYLSRTLETKLKEKHLPVIPAPGEEYRSGIVILRTSQARSLVNELSQRNIIVSSRGEGLRISVNIFNNEEDIDKLISSLQSLRKHLSF
jgi:cysteine desulfurase / selenocysteine lyase